MEPPKKRLGDLLLECGLISEEQLKLALARQKELNMRVGEALVHLKFVTNDDIIWAISNQLGISYINLTDDIVDLECVRKFPKEVLKQYKFLPIFEIDDTLTVAMADPLDEGAHKKLKELSSSNLKISVTTVGEIEEFIEKAFKLKEVYLEGKVKLVEEDSVIVEFETGLLKIKRNVIPEALYPGAKIFFKPILKEE